jgi:Leucine rich repeat
MGCPRALVVLLLVAVLVSSKIDVGAATWEYKEGAGPALSSPDGVALGNDAGVKNGLTPDFVAPLTTKSSHFVFLQDSLQRTKQRREAETSFSSSDTTNKNSKAGDKDDVDHQQQYIIGSRIYTHYNRNPGAMKQSQTIAPTSPNDSSLRIGDFWPQRPTFPINPVQPPALDDGNSPFPPDFFLSMPWYLPSVMPSLLPSDYPSAIPSEAPTKSEEPSGFETASDDPTSSPAESLTPTKAIPTPIPEATPSVSPNESTLQPSRDKSGCEDLPRDTALIEQLSNVTNLDALLDDSTPQGRAKLWLQEDDPANVDPCTYETLLQRYALATMYFSTDGDGWTDNKGWLSGENECTWSNVECIMVDNAGQVANLTLVGNNLDGKLPDELHVLDEMSLLDVSVNFLSGTIPAIYFESLLKLTRLHLNANSLSGSLPSNIDGLSGSLEELELSDNLLSGTIPSSIANLQKLKRLLMATNELVGSIPTEMGTMRLVSFFGNRNQLSGSIPEEFWANTQLASLGLSDNQFSGTISSSVGNLRSILLLDLSGNRLSGTIPILLGRASSLEGLDLSNNQLVGTVRDIFSTFADLQTLDLSLNGITGSIPSGIFDLATVRSIALNGNGFDGTIPGNFGNAVALESLLLHDNTLTGPVPDIQQGPLALPLASLEELQLQNNQLTGSMAQSVCNLREEGTGVLESLSADCGEAANPMIECEVPACCTLCFPVSFREQGDDFGV